MHGLVGTRFGHVGHEVVNDGEEPTAPAAPQHSQVEAFATPSRSLPMDVQSQGFTNACGTTSLANVLTYWGQRTDHETIDASIRHFNLFTAPDDLVGYARQHGLRAELKANATLADLTRLVDEGAPPIVLIDPDGGSNANLHYVTVCGYQRDATGAVCEIEVADSASGKRRTLAADEFQREWANLKLKDVGTGLHDVMISVVPNDARPVRGADGVTRRACDLQLPTSDARANAQSAFARGVAQTISGAANATATVGNALAHAAQSVARFFSHLFGG